MTFCRWAALAAALIFFVVYFRPGRPQWLTESLWLVAIGLWAFEVRRFCPRPFLDVRIRRADVLTLALILLVFVAAWLPFYRNWRWAYTGDSLALFYMGRKAVAHGLWQSLLSVRGVDSHFTYLFSLAYNTLMFVFEPSLFWHRITQLVVTCAALATIYAYFRMALGRWWAVAIVLATATNYVWIWFSYISYGKIDSYIFYYLMLIYGTLIWRRPDHLGAWLLCGLTAGWSLFFTPSAWTAVAAVGVVFGLYALLTRRFSALAVMGVSFLLVATPLILQFSGFLEMTSSQARLIFKWDYLLRIFTMILWFPYYSPTYNLSVQGALLRWPLGSLYLAGMAISVLGLVPPLRRLLRMPIAAPILLLLIIWDAWLMTLTNNAYGHPSIKRCYNLIPNWIFMSLLPAYILYAWLGRLAWLRRATAIAVSAALVVYAWNNLQLIRYPRPGIYGTNTFDGLIELRQRFPERRVWLLTRRQDYVRSLRPHAVFHREYEVLDQLTLHESFDDDTVARAREENALLCFEYSRDGRALEPLIRRHNEALVRFPLLNTKDMRCYESRRG